MNEPRNSPQRRKQFLVICLVMAVCFLYSFTTSGGFTSIEIEEGEFPGGSFVFKRTKRDYAASQGLARFIAKEGGVEKKQHADVVYTIYFDDPRIVMGGRQQRFAAGLLAVEEDDRSKQLLSKNFDIHEYTDEDFIELSAAELWPKIKYETEVLPRTKAAVIQFPFTDGFISALMLTWRIIPALRQRVEQSGEGTPAVVITTCSVDDQMCTHYAPFSMGETFLLGEPDCKQYAKALGKSDLFDFSQTVVFLKKVFPFVTYFSSDSKSQLQTEEL
ncbi:hypothetical protein FisN_1Hh581 [Fistulifera solaris]|uniref:Uncharacterized protein n=1 Tax=Fistulifera solaris TaxID=1519565 RepID=A0A1Z5KRS9_FISSO|nr:hypothetical protein FisN_1Hh581 [Fistulifera solaris]|eukprot:GAX28628.1 hypothetical protein FisN_1Hh581 [Fistulifera solaris]